MFKQNCEQASAILRQLETWAHSLEEGYLLLEAQPPTEDELALASVLSRIVVDVWKVSSKLHEILPAIGQEEPNVAYAIQLAADEICNRVRHVQEDLNRHMDMAALRQQSEQAKRLSLVS